MYRYRNYEECKEIQCWQRPCYCFDQLGKSPRVGKPALLVQPEKVVRWRPPWPDLRVWLGYLRRYHRMWTSIHLSLQSKTRKHYFIRWLWQFQQKIILNKKENCKNRMWVACYWAFSLKMTYLQSIIQLNFAYKIVNLNLELNINKGNLDKTL